MVVDHQAWSCMIHGEPDWSTRAAGQTGRRASGLVHTSDGYPHAIAKNRTSDVRFAPLPRRRSPPYPCRTGGLVARDRSNDPRATSRPAGAASKPSTHAGARRWPTISTRNTNSVKRAACKPTSTLKRAAEIVFPNRIGELRKNATPIVSQRELSIRVGISERQIRRIEQGRAVPDAKLLWRIAKALAVSAADLYLKRRDGRS